MLVRMLRGTGGPDGSACEAGEVYDLPDPLAVSWISSGRAVADGGVPAVDGGITLLTGDPVVRAATAPPRRRR